MARDFSDAFTLADSDSQHSEYNPSPTAHRARKLPEPRQRAHACQLADDGLDTSVSDGILVDKTILEKIQKCLALGDNPSTEEPMAQKALRHASRLMAEYNVTRVEVYAAARTKSEQQAKAGTSDVKVSSTKGNDHKSIKETWARDVASAMTKLFDVRYYSTAGRTSLVWTFYGIAANTKMAALGFEMAYNLIQEWGRSKGRHRNDYFLGCGRGMYNVAKETKAEEEKLAHEQERHDLEARVKVEEEQRQREINRLHRTPATGYDALTEIPYVTSGSRLVVDAKLMRPLNHRSIAYVGSDDGDACRSSARSFGRESEDDAGEGGYGFEPNFKEEDEAPLNSSHSIDDEIKVWISQCQSTPAEKADPHGEFSTPMARNNKPRSDGQAHASLVTTPIRNIKPEPINNPDQADREDTPISVWGTPDKLILYRKSAMAIAESVLQDRDKKLKKSRKRKRTIRDFHTYRQGKKDGRSINVKVRRLEGK